MDVAKRRWAAILKDGSIVGVGAPMKKFELKRIVFIEGGLQRWREGGSYYARLMDGNFATILRHGSEGVEDNIHDFKHKRIRRYTKRMERREYS